MKKIFRKWKKIERINKYALVATDIENDPVTGNFICAALYGYRKDHHGKLHEIPVTVYHKQDEYCTAVANLSKCKLVFFNMAYDYPFLQSVCDDSKLLTVGGRYISGETKNGIKMVDMMNHVDGSLEEWIGYLNMNASGIEKVSLEDLTERVTQDTKATYVLAEYIQEFYINVLKIPMPLTIASGARRFFQQYYFKDWWERDNEELDFMERMSYRGGRTEVFKYGKQKMWSYDVNSMYLSVMRDCVFPDPNSAKIWRNVSELPKDKIYIAKCVVEVPKQYVPPLPYFKEKLLFPTGTLSGVWCSPELEYAIKECGCVIKSIEWVITYKSKPYFKEFAKFVWNERVKFKKEHNKGMDLMIKKIGNSLYGGFGQKNSVGDFMGKEEDSKEIEIKEGDKIVRSIINGVTHLIISSSDKVDSDHTFTCLPTFTTSYSRVKLLKKLKEHEAYVVYCDTDCVKITKKLDIDEKELGGWGFEADKSGERFFYRPKMIRMSETGEFDKMKGVPKKGVITGEDEETVIFAFKKPNRYRESVRRRLVCNMWEDREKCIKKTDDKRVRIDGNDSKAIHIKEVIEEK